MRGDDGFEDREGHQAPVTLRHKNETAKRRNGDGATQRRIRKTEKRVGLLKFFDCLDDIVEVRPVTGVEFGMEQFAIGANLESAAARGNQRERFNALAELENFGRQTDGLRRVISNDAVFD